MAGIRLVIIRSLSSIRKIQHLMKGKPITKYHSISLETREYGKMVRVELHR